MAEQLLTSERLDDYLKTLDMTSSDNKRVLSAIQTLHPELMEDLLYFMVEGRINISALYAYSINNKTAKMLIQDASNSTDIVNYLEFYKQRVRAMPTYKNFLKAKKAETQYTLKRTLMASRNFVAEFTIDELGLQANTFLNLFSVFSIYDDALFSLPVQTEIARANALVTSLTNLQVTGVKDFHTAVIDQISEYVFLRETEGRYSRELGSETVIGFIVRKGYLDLQYTNLVDNLAFVYSLMGEKFSKDTSKTGWEAISLILQDPGRAYSDVFSAGILMRESNFLADLRRIVTLRKTFVVDIYGTAYTGAATINNQKQVFDTLVEYFAALNGVCTALISGVRDRIEESLNANA